MLQNAYFLAKIGADTAENEQHFAEILPKFGNYPTHLPHQPREKPRPAALTKEATRAAHHIHHLLREEQAANAESSGL